MWSQLYVFHSLWSFFGWFLFLVLFFTAVGSYRVRSQQLTRGVSVEDALLDIGKLSSTPPANYAAVARQNSRGDHSHTHASSHTHSNNHRGDDDSVYSSDEELIYQSAFNNGGQHSQHHHTSSHRDDRASKVDRDGARKKKKKKSRDENPYYSHSRHHSQPSIIESINTGSGNINRLSRGSHHSDRLSSTHSVHLHPARYTSDNKENDSNDDNKRIKSATPLLAQRTLSGSVNSDVIDDGHNSIVDQYDEMNDPVANAVELESELNESLINDTESNIDAAEPRFEFLSPILLPTPALSVYYELSHLIRQAWLDGILRQQRLMLINLIDREKITSKISDIYSVILKKLMSYYESEIVPDKSKGEIENGLDLLSVWQHELGERKIEDSIGGEGEVVEWMCQLIQKVAAQAAAVNLNTHRRNSSDLVSDASAAFGYSAVTELTTRLQQLLDWPLPSTPPIPTINFDDTFTLSLPSLSLSDSANNHDPLPPLPVIEPFDAREITLRYLSDSHAERALLAQQLCSVQRSSPTLSSPAPATPPQPSSLSSLQPIYVSSVLNARYLNVDLMNEMELVLTEIQQRMEENLSQFLNQWNSRQQQQSLTATIQQSTPTSHASQQSPGAPSVMTHHSHSDSFGPGSLTAMLSTPISAQSRHPSRAQSATMITGGMLHISPNQPMKAASSSVTLFTPMSAVQSPLSANSAASLPPLPPPSFRPASSISTSGAPSPQHPPRSRHHRSKSLSTSRTSTPLAPIH